MNKSDISYDNKQEIDLIQLISLFWFKKGLFLTVLFVCAGLGGLLAYSIKPVYQVQYMIVPPLSSDISLFGLGRTSNTVLQPLKTGEVYRLFKGLLFSEQAKNTFLNEYKKEWLNKQSYKSKEVMVNETTPSQKAIKEAWSRIKIQPIQSNLSDYPTLQVNANTPAEAVDVGKKFFDYLQMQTRKSVYQSVQTELDGYEKYYQKEIASGQMPSLVFEKEKIDITHTIIARLDAPFIIDAPINRKTQLMIMFLSVLGGCFLSGIFITLRYYGTPLEPHLNQAGLKVVSNE